jgi:hypothetical protein
MLSFGSARAQERLYEVALFGSLTTSSKLFYAPNSPDEISRGQFFPIDNIVSAGIDLRRRIEPLQLQIGVSIEYLSKTDVFQVPVSASRSIPVRDGFTAIPIELSGYFFIPIGTERLRVYMGGGGGAYIGWREYEFPGAEAPIVGRKVGYGIQVQSGVTYRLLEFASLRSEVKFRDVQFESTNKFQQASTEYRGRTIELDQSPIVSRTNIDGMTVTLGLVVHF